MKEVVSVLFRGALANYRIRYSDKEGMEANLTRYMGEKKNTPRQFFYIETQGKWMFENNEEQILMEAICRAANLQALTPAAEA